MLESLSIANFQSIHSLNIDLAPYTVIVGPSSSGKSALTRAIKTLSSNQRGSAFITHGERQCTISAQTENHIVTLDRGKRNEYTVTPKDENDPQHYTKLNGTTPLEVSQALTIPADSPIHFASQFDMPYLLTSSPAESARTLASLTNVEVIYSAAREAHRQRLAHSQTLKTRNADRDALTDQQEAYANLPQWEEALSRAEEAHERAQQAYARAQAIAHTIRSVQQAQDEIKNLPAFRPMPEHLEIDRLEELAQRISGITSTLRQIKTAHASRTRLKEEYDKSTQAVRALERRHTAILEEAGACPTCGAEQGSRNTQGSDHSHTVG